MGGSLEKYQENCHCQVILKFYFNCFITKLVISMQSARESRALMFSLHQHLVEKEKSQWGCRAGVYGNLLPSFKEILL